jgi:MFS family permease
LWYGWVVLGVVFLSMGALIAVRSSFGVFFKSVAGEFGWNRVQTSGAFSAGLLGQALGSPLAGWLMDRWSIRATMSLGILFAGLAAGAMAFTNGLPFYYATYFLLCLAFAGGTWVAQVPTLSNWFVARRGMAMGLTNSAQGFAFFLNAATPFLIAALGWRGSYLTLGGMLAFFTFPIVALLHRDHPRQMGTVADAPFPAAGPPPPAKKGAAPRAGVALFSLSFALVAGVYASIAFSFSALIVHLVPHATDQGFSAQEGGLVLAAFGGVMVGGNLLSAVSDRFGRLPTYWAGALLGALASAALAGYALETPKWIFYLATALSGFALGLVRPTASSLLADHFAGPGFGKINGAVMGCFALAGAAGPAVTGAFFDAQGSYRAALWLVAAFFLLGAVFAGGLAERR